MDFFLGGGGGEGGGGKGYVGPLSNYWCVWGGGAGPPSSYACAGYKLVGQFLLLLPAETVRHTWHPPRLSAI